MKDYYYADSEGGASGPVPLSTLEQWLKEDRLHLDSWVLEAGTQNWISLSSLALSARSIPRPPPAVPITSQNHTLSQDQVIFADSVVSITATRVVIKGTTYALRNITSVKVGVTPAKQGCAAMLLVFGLIMGVTGFGMVSGDAESRTPVPLIVGIIALVLAIFWLRSGKSTYHVVMSSSSGEVQALSSLDRNYIQTIIESINEAIVRYK